MLTVRTDPYFYFSKVYFTELPKEIQQRFNYDTEKASAQEATARSSRKPEATPAAPEPMATSGIETLPPITVKLNDELLNALKMTDELDALYKRGCSSDGQRFIVRADEKLTAFVELESSIRDG